MPPIVADAHQVTTTPDYLHVVQWVNLDLPFLRRSFYLANYSLCQLNHQRRLLPQHECSLIAPLFALFAKLHIEIPEHPRKDGSHLGVRQTGFKSISRITLCGTADSTHVCPIQFRGPVENGWCAALWSSA